MMDLKPKGKHMTAIVAAGILVGGPMTLSNEGLKLKPYYDGAGIKTWCGGETEVGYKPQFTYQECKGLFDMRYGYYSVRTSYMYNATGESVITPQAHAAFTDMAYNVGLGTVEKSSMIRKLNAGDLKGACMSILKYKLVKGHDCSLDKGKPNGCYGVWDRRLRMSKLCLGGTP